MNMGLNKHGYYSLREILGYNCKYNIVLSDRGRGKSWEAKWFLLKQEGTFMCVTRQKPDMQMQIRDFIEPYVKGDDEHEKISAEMFEWKGNDQEGWELWYGGQVKGYFRYLTQVNHIKQEVFPDDLNWVWVDEFIPLVYKKLPGVISEGDALRTIVKTIEHDTVRSRESKGLKPVRVIMFANPFTWDNPILSYFHIDGLQGPGVHRAGPGVAWELLEPYEEERKSGKMTVDDFLGDEVYKNMGFLDQAGFVENVAKGAVLEYQIRIGRNRYWVWKRNGLFYVKKSDKDNRNIACYGTMNGRQPWEASWDACMLREFMKKMAHNGKIRYDDINVKFDFIADLFETRKG